MHRFAVPAVAAWFVVAHAAAQVCDPVPTRIRYEVYGASTGTPSAPRIDLALDPAGAQAAVVIVDGTEGYLACSLIGSRPASVSLPFGAIALVEPDIAVMPGLFDAAACCRLPWLLAERALVGVSCYFQGVNLGPVSGQNPAIVTFQLSSAIRLDYLAGNEQPPLPYAGPPLTATPVYSRVPIGPAVLPRFDVRTCVVAPTSGWVFSLDQVEATAEATIVYMTLEAPGPGESVLQVLTPLPVCVDAGRVPSERIEIRVRCTTRDVGCHGTYELAAMIATDY
jgi:hypothetical protein